MNLQDLLIKHEGFKVNPYADTMGHQTVGVGHNLDASPLPDEMYPMSNDRVLEILNQDIVNMEAQLSQSLSWAITSLDPVRYAVICDMAFNMGIKTLLTFTHTLQFIKNNDWENASKNMLESLWAKQVGKRAIEDAQMMLTGLWPDDPNFNSSTSS